MDAIIAIDVNVLPLLYLYVCVTNKSQSIFDGLLLCVYHNSAPIFRIKGVAYSDVTPSGNEISLESKTCDFAFLCLWCLFHAMNHGSTNLQYMEVVPSLLTILTPAPFVTNDISAQITFKTCVSVSLSRIPSSNFHF